MATDFDRHPIVYVRTGAVPRGSGPRRCGGGAAGAAVLAEQQQKGRTTKGESLLLGPLPWLAVVAAALAPSPRPSGPLPRCDAVSCWQALGQSEEGAVLLGLRPVC